MDEKKLLQQIDRFIEQNEAAIVRDIGRLVAVPSQQDMPTAGPGAPYGKGPRAALDTALSIAQQLGLATCDGDGHVGWAELPGRQNGYLATITHVDVVPEGEGWDGDAFTLRQRDGWLLGRGVIDDKGPSILCLYAAKFLKESGTPLRYGLRVLLGCAEETGMSDVDYYLANNPEPLFCFSPDADFPLCNGEKGHIGGELVSPPISGGRILGWQSGLAPNVIPGKADCLVDADPATLQSTEAVTVQDEGGKARLTAIGTGGHAAHPDGTQNAIGLLVDYLLQNNLCSVDERAFLTLLQKLHQSPYGEGLGIACQDDKFGPLTLNGGVVSLADGRLRQSVDIRYPTATTGDQLTAALTKAAAAHGAGYTPDRDDRPFYIEADSAPIRALLQCYADVTGQPAKPFTMGGGTYARHFQNAVSFGPALPDIPLPDFAAPEHAANEGAHLPTLLMALKVYILALCRLQAVDF